jgi:hypothetical protein
VAQLVAARGGILAVMMKMYFVVAVLVGLLGQWTPVVCAATLAEEI